MNDIFLSYDRSDRAVAQMFADALEAHGWTVWWDREIPLGKDFGETIEKMLESARCVIVLWSSSSVLSRWVKTEAAAAADKNRLAPVFIEQGVVLPLEFRRIQAAELWGWSGDSADPEFRRLLEAVEQIVGSPAPTPESIPSAPKPKPRQSAERRVFPLKSIGLVAAVVLVIALLIVILKPGSDSSTAVEPPAGANTGGGGQVEIPAEAIKVHIGDRIEEGRLPGAGKIEKPFEKDLYVFQARPGQRVYFRVLKYGDGLASIKWRLVDAEDTKVFDACLGCTEPGVQVLTRGGTYLLTVGSENDPATGTYRLQLYDVPPPQQFAVKIGDAVKENQPAPGAGAIESPGVSDVYMFKAAAGQRVYFRIASHSDIPYMKWRLVDDNDMQIFDACFGCTEPGAITLSRGGDYTLTVGHPTNPSTGTYRLQLFDVPIKPEIPIQIGDRVRPGVPVAGAGVIESPGSEDVFVFTAKPGEMVSFVLRDHSGAGTDYLKWRLTDANETEIFSACFGCSQPGRKTLMLGGKYTLTVGHPGNPSTGTYDFELGR